MKHSVKTGLSFGLTSAVITTLGLMAGLYSGTNSRAAVLGAVIMAAIADGLSDAIGIHVSEEAENTHSHRTVWEATFSTFVSKSVVALTFAVPVVFLELKAAVATALGWGFVLLVLFSCHLGTLQHRSKLKIAAEHIAAAALVVAATYSIGLWISARFGNI